MCKCLEFGTTLDIDNAMRNLRTAKANCKLTMQNLVECMFHCSDNTDEYHISWLFDYSNVTRKELKAKFEKLEFYKAEQYENWHDHLCLTLLENLVNGSEWSKVESTKLLNDLVKGYIIELCYV